MNHTHYALFYDCGKLSDRLVAILPKDFKEVTLSKAIRDDTGSDVVSVTFNKAMLGRSMHTAVNVEFEDYDDQFYLQPTWLYENE